MRQYRGDAPSITNTERCQSANLLQMPKGLMCKLRQRGQGYAGRPAGSRGFDPSLQPPPAVAARLRENAKTVILAQNKAIDGRSKFRIPSAKLLAARHGYRIVEARLPAGHAGGSVRRRWSMAKAI